MKKNTFTLSGDQHGDREGEPEDGEDEEGPEGEGGGGRGGGGGWRAQQPHQPHGQGKNTETVQPFLFILYFAFQIFFYLAPTYFTDRVE
jgi:hypothetical protein